MGWWTKWLESPEQEREREREEARAYPIRPGKGRPPKWWRGDFLSGQ
jgi:hypothetical protein